MLPFFQERTRDREMGIGRRGDGGSIDEFGELIERIGRAHTILLRDLGGVGGVGVVDRGKIRRFVFGVETGVVLPDVSDSDYSDAKILHGRARLEN